MNPARGSYEQSGEKYSTARTMQEHYRMVRRRLMEAKPPAPVEPEVIQTLPMVSAIPLEISRYSPQWTSRRTMAQTIIHECAEKYGVRVEDLKGPRRQRNLIPARHEAMYRLKEEMPMLSLPQIGRMLGGRDHTTVLYGARKHQERMMSEEAGA